MLHISKGEQKSRLQARLGRPQKWWKFSPNDVAERSHWSAYQKAYEDAVNNCSTECAPWHVVPANHKWARNLALAETVLRTLKEMVRVIPGFRSILRRSKSSRTLARISSFHS